MLSCKKKEKLSKVPFTLQSMYCKQKNWFNLIFRMSGGCEEYVDVSEKKKLLYYCF